MKNKFAVLTVIMVSFLFFQCQKDWIEETKEEIIEPYFPQESKEWGQLFASNLNYATKQAKQQKIKFNDKEQIYLSTQMSSIDFLQKNRLKSAKVSFLEQDLCEINHKATEHLKNNVFSLSEKQEEILELIANAKKESDSYIAFSNRLAEINDLILKIVPDKEQSRLFFVTSTLYYGLKEINNLVSEGIIPGTPEGESLTLSSLVRLKSTNIEDDTDGGSWWCNDDSGSMLASVWLIALAEPTPAGEIVATGATIIIGGILLYEFIGSCIDYIENNIDVDECIQLYVICTDNTPYYPCDDCLHFCRSNGYWDFSRCSQ